MISPGSTSSSRRKTSSNISISRCNSRRRQPNETEIRAKLASIGVGPGKTFNFKDLPLEQKLEIGHRAEARQGEGRRRRRQRRRLVNGWNVAAPFGDAEHYNGDWLTRAVAAQAGIYGNTAEEAMYPATRSDGQGKPIDCNRHNYTLTFPASRLPPVNAFWSVTMYDSKTQLLIKNPIDRYLINSPMLPKMKNKPRRVADDLHQEQIARPRPRSELAARARRPGLSGHEALSAQGRFAFDPACGKGRLEAAGCYARLVRGHGPRQTSERDLRARTEHETKAKVRRSRVVLATPADRARARIRPDAAPPFAP